MKEQIKAPKIEWIDEEIAILSDAEFKTLVIRKLTEMVEYGHKIEERVKAIKNKLKENAQGTNREGNRGSDQWFGPEGRKKHSTRKKQNEETRIQKHEERLRNLWDNFKHSNIWIIGMPKGEEEKQEIENLFDNKMKEKFLNLAKEIDFQEVQEA